MRKRRTEMLTLHIEFDIIIRGAEVVPDIVGFSQYDSAFWR